MISFMCASTNVATNEISQSVVADERGEAKTEQTKKQNTVRSIFIHSTITGIV